jgi:hypothetical protein
MEKQGYIEIRIVGKKGELPLAPDTYDISEIRHILDYAEDLLFPHERKHRPIISYEIKEGSVRHILKTSLQVVIGFNAVLGQISQKRAIDFLEHPTAVAISTLQETARKQNYGFQISTSVDDSHSLIIDTSTDYALPREQWVEAEFYFYGEITNMGGKASPNVHVSAPGLGAHIIKTPREVLSGYERNPLYKPMGVRARGKQNLSTGELEPNSLVFVEFIDYSPEYDEVYLNSLIKKTGKTWADIKDTDEWVREIRGGVY